MPIDPSIPLQVQAPQNPLANLMAPIQTATGLIGLQRASQQLQANRVISDAYSQATDPTTGQTDFGKLQALATQNGAGAFLPEFMGQIAKQRNEQQQFDVSKLDQALKQQSDVRNRVGALMASPSYGKGDMRNDIINTLGAAVGAGTLPLDVAQRELQSVPSDPQEQAQWIKQKFMQSLDGEAKLKTMMPQTQVVSTGGQQQILNIDPMTGQPKIAGTLQNTLTPAESAQRVSVFKDGQTGTVPLSSTVTPTGQAPAPGRYPGAATTDASGFLPSAPALGQAHAADVASGGAAEQYVADNRSVNGSGARVYQLQTALTALQNAPTGKGAEAFNTLKSYLQTANVPGVDADKIKNFDEANKYLTQYALNQAGQLGQGTDSKLATTLSGNASTSISNLAAQDVVKANIGLERMKQAQVAAFNQSGLPPEQYQKFSSQWNSKVDPRVFILDQLDPQAKAKLRDSMNPAQRQQFTVMYNTALRNNWIPGGQ